MGLLSAKKHGRTHRADRSTLRTVEPKKACLLNYTMDHPARRIHHEDTIKRGAVDRFTLALFCSPLLASCLCLASRSLWALVPLALALAAASCAAPLILGWVATQILQKLYPADGYRVTSMRVAAWLSRDDGSAACDDEVMLRVECTFGGCYMTHDALDGYEPTFLCYAERARANFSFGRRDVAALLRVLARRPGPPAVVRVDALHAEGCEGAAQTANGELNYRRFKRAVAEDAVARALPRRDFPNRASCRVAKWTRAPPRGDGAPRRPARPVVTLRVRELASRTARGPAVAAGGGSAAFCEQFRLPCPDLAANVSFRVDDALRLKKRVYGKQAPRLGAWSIRAQDFAALVAGYGRGCHDVSPADRARFGIVSGTVGVVDDDAAFVGHGGGPVLCFDGAVRTDGAWAPADEPPAGVLELSLRLSRAPDAPDVAAQLRAPSRALTPLEQLSLAMSELSAFKKLRPPKRDRILFRIRRCIVSDVRLGVKDLLEKIPEAPGDSPREPVRARRPSRGSLLTPRAADGARESLGPDGARESLGPESFADLAAGTVARQRSIEELTRTVRRTRSRQASRQAVEAARDDDAVGLSRLARLEQLRGKAVFYVPIMDLSGGVRDGAGASPTSPRPSLSAAAKTIPDGSRDAGTVEALSQRAATRRLINEALRQLRDDRNFEWDVATTLFSSDGAARTILATRVADTLHAFYVARRATSALRRYVFNTRARERHVYAGPADASRLAAPCLFRGYMRKRTHRVAGGSSWHYSYLTLRGGAGDAAIFYCRHAACVNSHGARVTDPFVIQGGGTTADGPLKKLVLDDFDVELDESEAASSPSYLDRAERTGTVTITPRGVPGRHARWNLQLQSVRGARDTRAFYEALVAHAGPRAARWTKGDVALSKRPSKQRDARDDGGFSYAFEPGSPQWPSSGYSSRSIDYPPDYSP